MRDEIDEWRGKLDDLKVRANLGKMEARDRLQAVLEDLHQRVEESEEKLHHVSEATAETWSEIGHAFKTTWHDVKTSIEHAVMEEPRSGDEQESSGSA